MTHSFLVKQALCILIFRPDKPNLEATHVIPTPPQTPEDSNRKRKKCSSDEEAQPARKNRKGANDEQVPADKGANGAVHNVKVEPGTSGRAK